MILDLDSTAGSLKISAKAGLMQQESVCQRYHLLKDIFLSILAAPSLL